MKKFILDCKLSFEVYAKSVREKATKCFLTLSWRGPLSYRNQSIDLQSKSMDWFLYVNGYVMKELIKYIMGDGFY